MAFRKFEYRLYPNPKQARRLGHQLRVETSFYNELLTLYKEEYYVKGIKLGRYDLFYHITSKRKENPEYNALYRHSLYKITTRLYESLKRFFRETSEWRQGRRGKPGLPRYKKSVRSIDISFESVKIIDKKTVSVGKIGRVEAVIHRPIEGRLKEATIVRKNSGKWFIIFTCEVEENPIQVDKKPDVGIDLGLLNFATLSDGTIFENPRCLSKSEKRINKLQRKLSRKCKGSNNWRKNKRLLASAYEHLENQRNDFLHKTSRNIVDKYGFIALETLDINPMLAEGRSSKYISDVSWYKFAKMLEYKASSAGSQVVYNKPFFPSSQICSECGQRKTMSLYDRTYNCPHCGLVIDRDLNAAKNILNNSRAGSARIDACGDETSTSFNREKRVASWKQEPYSRSERFENIAARCCWTSLGSPIIQHSVSTECLVIGK